MDNVSTTINSGLYSLITRLQKEKEDLSVNYSTAIQRGEKYQNIKMLYLTLQDVDKKLRDLMRISYTEVAQ